MRAAVTQRKYDLGCKKVFVTGGSGFVGRTLIQTLVANEVEVVAIARSDSAEKIVKDCGAFVERGDVSDMTVLKKAMQGCGIVFHCAALTDISCPWEQFNEVIVEGTRRVLQAALDAGVARVVNVSSEAALMCGLGKPLCDIDDLESNLPHPDEQIGLNYPRAKNMAERICQEFSSKIVVVTVRPRFIWGLGDTVIMKHLVEQAQSFLGFAWVGGAEYRTSTANISNVIHGLLLASQKGVTGASYFITDGEELSQKDMFTQLFNSQNIDVSSFWSMPVLFARLLAWSGAIPDLNDTSLALLAQQVTVKCPRARKDLGYAPIVSMAQGMEELRAKYREEQEK